ncbi:MAG TPA: GGDEF domain-containing protein [Curvibacter sp.]|nr:GGDEF domain-containing protein [Curvibacter sp.]
MGCNPLASRRGHAHNQACRQFDGGSSAAHARHPAKKVRPIPLRPHAVPVLRSFVARLVLAVLALNLGVILFAAWALQQSRLQFEERAAVTTDNLARLMGHDITASMRLIDQVLLTIVTEAEHQLAGNAAVSDTLNTRIEQQLKRLPELGGLRLANAQGELTHGTGVSRTDRVSIADRDYYSLLRRQPDAGLVIGQPVQGRISGKWVITLSRAIRGPDGTFAGVVVGAVPLTHFIAQSVPLQIGAGGAFALFDDSFRLVVRHPSPGDMAQSVGMPFGSPELRRLLASGQTSGAYKSRSSVDNVERISSFRKIEPGALNLVIGLAADDYLAGWREEVLKAVAMVLLFMLASAAFCAFIYRAWRNQNSAVAALQAANRTLDAEKHLNKTIIQSSPFAIYTRNRQGIITAWNLAAEKLFGWRADEVVGKSLPSVPVSKEDETRELRERVLNGESIIQLEVQRQKRDGTAFDLSTTLAPLRGASGEIDGYLAIATDITERKQAARQIEFLAYRDVLTGLPNRLLLHDRFAQAVAYADRANLRVALLFLDLDNFKTINDSLGHAVGDALLKEIALRLGACVRETDTISRQGGDEFLIVLPDLLDTDAISPVLAKIRERLHDPFELDGHELTTSASIGIAIYPSDGRDFDTLLKKADTAMYQAKDAGRNSYRFFDEQMNVKAVEHLSLKSGLRRAIARSEFELHYQPQIDLVTGAVVGAEALLRWNHPDLGLVSPARFIPVAEDSGLIVPIGEWVIQEACSQGAAWKQAGLPPLVMAVNLSAVEFRRGDVEQKVIRALQDSGLDPHWLELELTESILIHNTEQVLATVQRLKRLGVKLSIDDFGTGYSSLSYLKRFEVDKLKIDQSFIRDLATDSDDAAIIRAIIQMARSLNLRTIAEGVEDAGMLAQLRLFECDEAQGYLFARPMPAPAFTAFVAEWSGRQLLREGDWVI